MIKPIEITQEHYKSGTAELAMKLNQIIGAVNAICRPTELPENVPGFYRRLREYKDQQRRGLNPYQ